MLTVFAVVRLAGLKPRTTEAKAVLRSASAARTGRIWLEARTNRSQVLRPINAVVQGFSPALRRVFTPAARGNPR